MILNRPLKEHVGKVVKHITADGTEETGCVMAGEVRIQFTDGTHLRLRPDWRGTDCYLSEYTDG